MSLPDHLWGSILNYITVPHPWVSDLNELTRSLPLLNIELRHGTQPMGKSPQ